MPRPVVWVLAHDLSRSGVPMALTRMAAWQAHHAPERAELHVVAVRSGSLAAALRVSCASVTTLDPADERGAASTLAAGAAQLGHDRSASVIRGAAWRVRVRHLPTPDVVLVHGAGGWLVHRDLARFLPDRCRLVVHLHELATALDRSIPAADQRAFLSSATTVLAVAPAVADLARQRGGSTLAVAIVPGVADALGEQTGHHARDTATSHRRQVVSIGAPGWRKGTDRALAVAHALARTNPDVACTWIGGPVDPTLAFARGTASPLGMIAGCPQPWDLVPPGSVLLVPSREDPLPLVVLEAGRRAIPVVAADTGGLADLLATRRGLVVPGHDLAAMAAAVTDTLGRPEAAAERARRLADHVALHFSAEVVGPQWLDAVLGV